MLDQNIFPPFYLKKFEIVLWKAFTWAPCAHPLGAATNIGRHLHYPPSTPPPHAPSHHLVFLMQNKLHILVFILSKILKCAFWSLILLFVVFSLFEITFIYTFVHVLIVWSLSVDEGTSLCGPHSSQSVERCPHPRMVPARLSPHLSQRLSLGVFPCLRHNTSSFNLKCQGCHTYFS